MKSNCLFKPIINPIAYSINPLASEKPDNKIHHDGDSTLLIYVLETILPYSV